MSRITRRASQSSFPATTFIEPLEGRQLLAGTASISGVVFDDKTINGVHERGEGGIKGVRVYLDANNNGVWDKKIESSSVTDKRGNFAFAKLRAGTYRVRQVVPNDRVQVGPSSGFYRVTLREGQKVTRRMFGDASSKALSKLSEGNVTTAALAGQTITGGAARIDLIAAYRPGNTINYGSTDFSGMVNFDDYASVGSGTTGGTSGWFQGEFDLNGTVNFDDYTLIDLAFNTQSGTLRRAVDFLDGTDRTFTGMSGPALQSVLRHYEQFGAQYANTFLAGAGTTTTSPPITDRTAAARSAAKADYEVTRTKLSIPQAKLWLTRQDRAARQAPGVEQVAKNFEKHGADYKTEFLRLAAKN